MHCLKFELNCTVQFGMFYSDKKTIHQKPWFMVHENKTTTTLKTNKHFDAGGVMTS